MNRRGRLLLLHLTAAALVIGGTAIAEAQSTSRPQSGTAENAAPPRGDSLARALPAPAEGQTARERVEDNAETGQVRVQRVYQDADGKPVIAIVVRGETPESLKKRKAIFMDPDVVRSRKGEFREISGQRFAIVKIQGEYTATTFVDSRYSVLFFGTADRTTLLAYIISTDFARIGAVQ